jgi:hypothetical protein
VDKKFEDCFGASTTAGLYDRFIFARCPQPFTYDYRPFVSKLKCPPTAVAVSVDRRVWEEKSSWIKDCGIGPRIAENALRAAGICAGFDGKSVLRVQDLAPARAFAQYQMRVQSLLQPNPGENPDARCAFAILRTLSESPGEFMDRRAISKAIHAERFGPGVFGRAGVNLKFNGDVEIKTIDGRERWRVLP